MTKNQLTFTYLSILMATVIWGLNMILLKVLVTELPPATMTAFRIMTAEYNDFNHHRKFKNHIAK